MKHSRSAPVNGPREPLTTGPGYRLRTAFAVLGRELAYQLAQRGIAEPHYFYLRSLYEQDGLSQIELSGRVGVTPATATGVLDTMESLGLVTRVRDETDRRKTKIYLTRRGKALRRPLLEALEGVNRVILAGITEQQWKAFCHVLDTMTANVEAHRENRQAVTPKESRPTRKVKLSA